MLQPRVIWAVYRFENLAWALRVYQRALHACVLRVMKHDIFFFVNDLYLCRCESNHEAILYLIVHASVGVDVAFLRDLKRE